MKTHRLSTRPPAESTAVGKSRWALGIVLAMSALGTLGQMRSYNQAFSIDSMKTLEYLISQPIANTAWKSKERTPEAAQPETQANAGESAKENTAEVVANAAPEAAKPEPAQPEPAEPESQAKTEESDEGNTGETLAKAETEKAELVVSSNESDGSTTTFNRQENVVIVTKIHGPHQWGLLQQCLCLFHFAYNNKMHYDIVVFTADKDFDQVKMKELENIVAPAKLSLVQDNVGSLQGEIDLLNPTKRELFLERCGTTDPKNLTWWSYCKKAGDMGGRERLNYNWQAEFRGTRIWKHPALDNYKTMVWLDSDAFNTKIWPKDPIEYFIKNEGAIMFDHWPQGTSNHRGHHSRILQSFNDTTICDLKLDRKTGQFTRTLINREEYDNVRDRKDGPKPCEDVQIPNVHGFFHITNLDFFRQPKVFNGLNGMIGDCFLCRAPDDQLAVTLPTAMYAPEKSWDMRLKGFNLGVVHHARYDGQSNDPMKPAGFLNYWREVGKVKFPEAAAVCKITEGNR